MADDLDDALFSLAAGRNKPASKKRSRKNSESEDEGAISDPESEEAPRKKKSGNSKTSAGSKRGKKVQSEEEDDDDDDSEFDDQEGLFENEEDRRKLMAMTELEREMILADRAEARDKERQRKQLLQQRAVMDKAFLMTGSSAKQSAEEASLEELLGCQVTRGQLEDWVTQPFFERDALSGCVVRMAYGPGTRDTAGHTHPGYMIMEITDIRESGRSYAFGPRGEHTRKHLALRDGLGIVRVMAMANVSSKPFDQAEYERYLRHCSRANRAAITRDEAAAAGKKVEAAKNYRWTSADLKQELERKRASRAAPVNPAAEKAMLKRRIELAAAAKNVNEVAL
ncbi:hypothetical protein GPECTOR_70g473 [Gonium pectorale]|uniref:Plus3 domain-containing protein n=1 Tax=Gonium pectorale TaxID=33097 RepID=A0A150G351_GONPE|nr:hypothetical protein GPECTOR_70g473 [Gonium pectorale]|eukprot:KXZ44243.1 hypothetical protein GPECTOR_70g473 [Gonium pectorale]